MERCSNFVPMKTATGVVFIQCNGLCMKVCEHPDNSQEEPDECEAAYFEEYDDDDVYYQKYD